MRAPAGSERADDLQLSAVEAPSTEPPKAELASSPASMERLQLPKWWPRGIHPAGLLGLGVSCSIVIGLAACARQSTSLQSGVRDYGKEWSPRIVGPDQPVPKGGGAYKLGAPYMVQGRWYHPRAEPDYDRTGVASWYGMDFHGRKTANGEVYDRSALTAAHPTLPLPSYVTVTNLANGRTVLVRVNDRGPFKAGRIIDVSQHVAGLLGFERQGTAEVRVRYVGPAPLDGDDRREQAYLRGGSSAIMALTSATAR
jgi:rare lipoprotein A